MIRKGLRVGFCGAGGTGKTTTANAIVKATGLPFCKSASRVLYERLNMTEEKCLKLPDKDKLDLQFDIFATKINLEKNEYNFVSDRTLLDHWAYCLMYCGTFMPNDMFLAYEEIVRVHMLSGYSNIFYFPFGYWFEKGDGVRQDHYGWQSAIDAIIVGYLQRWDITFLEVPQTEGREERNSFVMREIQHGAAV